MARNYWSKAKTPHFSLEHRVFRPNTVLPTKNTADIEHNQLSSMSYAALL